MPQPPETECPTCDGAGEWFELRCNHACCDCDGPMRSCVECGGTGVIEVDECQVEEPSDADAA